MSNPAAEDATSNELPPQGVRTFLTFLIFLHLFALAVTISYQTGASSGFQVALFERTGVRNYVRLLAMNLGYDFHLTRDLGGDFDQVCDVVLDTPKGFRGDDEDIGRQQLKTIDLMPEDMWPGARRRRYLMLGNSVFREAGNDDFASNLPQRLTTGLLVNHGITEGKHQFRCRVIRPRGWGASQRDDDPRDPRYYVDVYRADIVSTGDGEWSLVKVVGENEATQLRGANSGSNQGGQQ